MNTYDCDFELDENDFINIPLVMEVKNISNKKINICLTKKTSFLDNITFSEIVDLNCLNGLIKSEQLEREFDSNNYSHLFSATIYKNVKHQLEEYFNKTYDKKINVFNVTYTKPRSKWGRVFPYRSLGLTSFGKKIRNTLIKGVYIDLDLSNAHPMILYNICKINDIPCPFVTQYINDRENILNDTMKYYNIDRDTAKKLFLRLIFFGTYNGFLKEQKINIKTKPLSFITDFINDLTHIAGIIKQENKQLYDMARRQNKTNTLGSFFSIYLQEHETRIMECVIQWLNTSTDITTYKNYKNKVLTYEFDGLKLLKENVDRYGVEKLKKDMEDIICEELGFSMTFEEKPIEKFYDIEYKPFVFIKPVSRQQPYYSETLIEKEEYFYNDYQQFINEVLSSNSASTENGDVFKKYYKQVFVKIDCGGQSKYFSKNIKNGFIDWTLLKSTPFGEKVSKFMYINLQQIGDRCIRQKLNIDSFISSFKVEDMTIYRDIDFVPYLHKDEVKDIDIFNIFTGFRFQPLHVDTDPNYYDNIQPILTHLKEVLCSNDEEVYCYIVKWLSHLIQRPRDKAGVPVILMKSEQGTGKNVFWDFMGQVMGKKYIVTINNLDDLTNKFNTRTEGKLLNILNEIQNYGGNYKNNEKLKSILTDIVQTIEPKGKEAYTINNFARSVMLTNNEWAAKIPNDDRRYVPIDVSNHKKDNNEYFKNICDIINDDKNAEIFFHYLSEYDISDFDIRKIPHTQLKENMKWFNVENRPLFYLKEYIIGLDDEKLNAKFSSNELFKDYCTWCDDNKERQTFSQRTFTQQIIKYGFNYIQFKVDCIQYRGFNITREDVKICIEKTLRIQNYNFDN
jgi:hypothetical protein